uniref:Phosphatidic acid phosphatase type 2/haloperoxidase domain-containing protein n=1 Tax=Romanomermis culicivorax TaxID=13658 RepID=A0A915HEN5_ROMCU
MEQIGRKKRDMDDRRRPYNSMEEEKPLNDVEMEAYKMRKIHPQDPMASIKVPAAIPKPMVDMRRLAQNTDVRLTERIAAVHGEFGAKTWFRLVLVVMEWSMHGLLWFLALTAVVIFSDSPKILGNQRPLAPKASPDPNRPRGPKKNFPATVFDMVDVGVLKLIFRRSRPPHNVDDMVVEAPYIDQFSFPSVYLYSLAMCASRILLGRHYVSDVVGGVLL